MASSVQRVDSADSIATLRMNLTPITTSQEAEAVGTPGSGGTSAASHVVTVGTAESVQVLDSQAHHHDPLPSIADVQLPSEDSVDSDDIIDVDDDDTARTSVLKRYVDHNMTMSVWELQAELKVSGQRLKGKKNELAKRLAEVQWELSLTTPSPCPRAKYLRALTPSYVARAVTRRPAMEKAAAARAAVAVRKKPAARRDCRPFVR